MRIRVPFTLTQEIVAHAILERARIECTGTGYLRPASRTQAMEWVRAALRGHGLALWASVDDAPEQAKEWAAKRAAELFPELG